MADEGITQNDKDAITNLLDNLLTGGSINITNGCIMSGAGTILGSIGGLMSGVLAGLGETVEGLFGDYRYSSGGEFGGFGGLLSIPGGLTGNGGDGLLDGLLDGDGLLGSLLGGILSGSGNTSVNIAGTILDTVGGILNLVGQTVNLGPGNKLGESWANNGLNILGNLNLLSGTDSILNVLNVLGTVGSARVRT